MSKPIAALRLSSVLLLLLAACGSSSDRSTVTLKLTDAAATGIQAAVVTITEISLQGTGGKTVLSSAKTTTNLLTLANDTATLVENVDVAVGTYTELRFVITGGYVKVVEAGVTKVYASSADYEGLPASTTVDGNLQMPSLAQSGLKVTMADGSLTVGTEAKILLVDFDVAQSFGHVAGNSGQWVLHPVIKGADFSLSGTVNASLKLDTNVTLPLVAGAQVTLGQFSATLTNSDGSPKTIALADLGSGSFGVSFKYLLPGSYTLDFVGPDLVSFTTAPARPAAVTVTSGQATAAAFKVTAASTP